MEGRLQIFAGNGGLHLAQKIVEFLEMPLGKALVTKFKNGETRVRIEENVRGSDVFVIQSMHEPVNDHVMELLIMIDALKRASARRITAVVPYYGYAKQEKKTAGREPISAKLLANLIMVAGAHRLLTLDLHAPAIEGFFDIPVDHLRAAPLLAEYFRPSLPEDPEEVVVVSPDAGGVGRANDFRSRIGAGLAIIAKQRPRPDVSEVVEMVGDVEGKTAILVDDMISTGGTLLEAARVLLERGAVRVWATATHGIFAAGALDRFAEGPIERIVVTDTIPQQEGGAGGRVEVVSVAPLLAKAILRIHKHLSLSVMFT